MAIEPTTDITRYISQQSGRDESDQPVEVWLLNLSDTLLTIDIENPTGGERYRADPIPPGPDPVPVSDKVPVHALEQSGSFRDIVQARFPRKHRLAGQPMCRLMSKDEVEAHYTKRAKRKGYYLDAERAQPDIERAKYDARMRWLKNEKRPHDHQEHYIEGHGFAPPRTAQELAGIDLARRGVVAGGHGYGNVPGALDAATAQRMGVQPGYQGEVVYMQDEVSPKVEHLCNQVSLQLEDHLRMPEADLFEELEALEASLGEADFLYIESHGTYAGVKKWARMKINEIYGSQEGIEGNAYRAGIHDAGFAPPPTQQALEGQGPNQDAQPQYQGPRGFVNTQGPMGPGSGQQG